jgi:hypothetical protein
MHVAAPEKRNRVSNASERRFLALHEVGHALVTMSIHGMDKVHKVSMIRQDIDSLGYAIPRPTEDSSSRRGSNSRARWRYRWRPCRQSPGERREALDACSCHTFSFDPSGPYLQRGTACTISSRTCSSPIWSKSR